MQHNYPKGTSQMEKQLLKLAISLLCLAVFIPLNLMEHSLIVRAISFFGGFMSGWGACYSIGCMVGEINQTEQE